MVYGDPPEALPYFVEPGELRSFLVCYTEVFERGGVGGVTATANVEFGESVLYREDLYHTSIFRCDPLALPSVVVTARDVPSYWEPQEVPT